jgi:hypothetical protein
LINEIPTAVLITGERVACGVHISHGIKLNENNAPPSLPWVMGLGEGRVGSNHSVATFKIIVMDS